MIYLSRICTEKCDRYPFVCEGCKPPRYYTETRGGQKYRYAATPSDCPLWVKKTGNGWEAEMTMHKWLTLGKADRKKLGG